MDEALRLQRHLPLFRACAGWTAKDLADQLEVSRQSVSAWENYDGGKEKKGVKLSKAYYLAIRHLLETAVL
jgi:DNA-binding XRE family transcriptional regulator